MKNLALSALIVFATTSAMGQSLKCDETIIRVNESFTVSVDLSVFIEQIKEQLPDNITFDDTFQSAEMRFEVVSQEEGPMTVGPFTFNWNGTDITTDSLVVDILPALELSDRVEISYLETEDGCYLITEQMVKDGKDDDTYMSVESPHFRGKVFSSRSLLRTTLYDEQGNEYYFRRSVYKIVGDGEYVPIDETLFKNLPATTEWNMEKRVRGGAS